MRSFKISNLGASREILREAISTMLKFLQTWCLFIPKSALYAMDCIRSDFCAIFVCPLSVGRYLVKSLFVSLRILSQSSFYSTFSMQRLKNLWRHECQSKKGGQEKRMLLCSCFKKICHESGENNAEEFRETEMMSQSVSVECICRVSHSLYRSVLAIAFCFVPLGLSFCLPWRGDILRHPRGIIIIEEAWRGDTQEDTG